MKNNDHWFPIAVAMLYPLMSLFTFVYLTFFDGYRYTSWNWLIAVPANLILASMWPIYWLILRPVFGQGF
jgi:hypothetical protein